MTGICPLGAQLRTCAPYTDISAVQSAVAMRMMGKSSPYGYSVVTIMCAGYSIRFCSFAQAFTESVVNFPEMRGVTAGREDEFARNLPEKD